MSKVFISYSRKIQTQVSTLSSELSDLGHEPWFDQRLAGGQSWWDEILSRIRDCDFIIVALSPDTLESQAAIREWTYAAELGKPLLPVLVSDGVSPNLLPGLLTRIQFVDYRSGSRQAAIALINAISKLPVAEKLPNVLPEPPEVPVSYLSSLKEQVETAESLSFEEQTAMIQRLETGAQNEEDLRDIRAVLERFKRREDLLATIDRRIESLLCEMGDAASQTVRSEGREVRKTPRSASEADTGEVSARSGLEPGARARPLSSEVAVVFAEGKNPVVATILSLLIVGLGQFYNGDAKKGAAMLVGAIVGGGLSAGAIWLLVAVWSAVDAYRVAKREIPIWRP